MGERPAKEAFPLFGNTPRGSSAHSMSKGQKKVEKLNFSTFRPILGPTHTWAADTSLVLIAVYIGTTVTRGFIKGGGTGTLIV